MKRGRKGGREGGGFNCLSLTTRCVARYNGRALSSVENGRIKREDGRGGEGEGGRRSLELGRSGQFFSAV